MSLAGIDNTINPSLFEKAQSIYNILIESYGLPRWRNRLSPMDELISTILSQNTNDANRDTAFKRLKEKFPSWEAVRDAPIADVIEAIKPAGLANQKGTRIQAILHQISIEKGGLDLNFLKELDREEARAWLSRFKGVGPKTAAIVLLFSLDIPAFPVDTHIYRVTGRLSLRPQKMSVEEAHRWLENLFLPSQYGPAHLNLIRLGREICHAREPECQLCPLNKLCEHYLSLQASQQG